MKLDLNTSLGLNKFKTYCKKLIESKAMVDLKKIQPKRTVKQNSYLHVCITLFAIETGYNIDEAKTHLKRNCNFMIYDKGKEKFLKRTRDLDTKELTDFIEWIRDYAGQHGMYIPSSEEYIQNRFEIDRQIETNKNYL
jgi:hypothetical protein